MVTSMAEEVSEKEGKTGDIMEEVRKKRAEEGWDLIKEMMAKAYVRDRWRRQLFRRLVVSFLRDYNGEYGTIVLTLEGSPPKAYAIITALEGDGHRSELIEVGPILILRPDLSVYKRIRTYGDLYHKLRFLSLNALLKREDVVLMNKPLGYSEVKKENE